MKKLIKKTILSLLIICMTLTCIGTTPVSAAAYKKSVTKTVTALGSEYYTLITITVKKDTTIKCTVKPKDGKECTMTSPSSRCKCSTCTILNHTDGYCDCGSTSSDDFYDYSAPKYTCKIKLTKGTHILRLGALGDGTHPNNQIVNITFKTTNGKNLIRIDKVEKKKY